MSAKRFKPRLAVTVDPEVHSRIEAAAKEQKATRSRIVNDVLRDAIGMGALGANYTLPRWDARHLQVVLDLAKTVEEVKDLVYTVLNKGWSLDFDSALGWNDPNLKELKTAIEARLKQLRRQKE